MMGSLRELSSVALWLGVIAAVGCSKSGGRKLRDSEGRTFSLTCKADDDCQLEQKSGPKRVEKPAQALMLGSRLVGLCDVTEGQPPEGPFDCRPLACESDPDCPAAHGMKDGQCLNHRCSDPAEQVGVQDSIMLCLSGTGLGRESAPQIERYAMALNCGSPCKIPAPCPQL